MMGVILVFLLITENCKEELSNIAFCSKKLTYASLKKSCRVKSTFKHNVKAEIDLLNFKLYFIKLRTISHITIYLKTILNKQVVFTRLQCIYIYIYIYIYILVPPVDDLTLQASHTNAPQWNPAAVSEHT